MTPAERTNNPVCPPRLDELTARFLARSASSPVGDDFDDHADVEPHEVVGGFRTDPRTGWFEVAGFARHFRLTAERLQAPPEWATFAGLPAGSPAVPLAAGLFPQQVRDPLPLLGTDDLTSLLPSEPAPISGFSALRGWVRKSATGKSPAAALAAAGLAAGLGDADQANAVLEAAEELCVGEWRAAWENQRAAVLWLTGKHAEALAAWQTMGDHPVAAFNAGMALLFLGRPSEAVPLLKLAADGLAAGSGWSHLANLLLLAAQARG